MDANTYQEQAMRTAASITDFRDGIITAALGLTGEAGEVADHVKKWVAQGHSLDREKLVKETGDVLWYVALLCKVLDVSMGEVMQANIEKLRARYPEGFTSEQSINRVA